MARVISIHEYELKPHVQPADFERALNDAERRGLLDLPGLIAHHFLRGLKGARRSRYPAIWIFESREAWERLWVWEQELLAPLLAQDPDTIGFTSYEEI